MVPGGIRMGKPFHCNYIASLGFYYLFFMHLYYLTGTPALTSRGFLEEDFVKVAEFFDAAVKLALKIKADTNGS